MVILSLLLNIVCLVLTIIVLIHAFKNSVGWGFACLCIPFVIIYYVFAKFEHPNKGAIIGGYVLAYIGSIIFAFASMPTY